MLLAKMEVRRLSSCPDVFIRAVMGPSASVVTLFEVR